MANDAIAIVVLAAGKSQRFGSAKQLAPVHQHTMLAHTLKQLPLNNIDRYVVLGANQEKIRKSIPAGIKIINNPDWQSGMASSIVAAVNSLQSGYTHLLITLGDQVAITTADYQAVLVISAEHSQQIICARYNGKNAVPAIFPACYFDELSTLAGDKGARDLLNRSEDIIPFELANGAIDIDTPEQLSNWLDSL